MFNKKIHDFGRIMEIEEYYDGRYGAPGKKREPKRKVTPEMMAARNHYNKVKKCRHQLRRYFKENDYYITLTCRKEERPEDMQDMQDRCKKFLQKLGYRYKKRDKVFHWIYNIEVGTKGAWHVHMVINRIADVDIWLRERWKYGRVDIQLIKTGEEDLRKLSEYLRKTPETDSRLREAHPSASRNMPLPPPRKRRLKKWNKKPVIPKDWQLDKQFYFEGTNPFTGMMYRTYTIMRC